MYRILLVSFSLLTAGLTAAQSGVEATKATKDLSTLIKPEFGALDYRYYYTQEYDESNELADELPIHQARATLGFKLLSKVDTTFVFAGNKLNQSQKITNRQPQMFASLPLVSGDVFNFAVYADTRLPVAGRISGTELGFNPSLSLALSREWSVAMNGDFEMLFSSDESTTVDNYERNSSQFSLANDSSATDPQIAGAKKEPSLQSDIETLVKYSPAAANGKLTIAAGVWFNTLWTPTYTYNDETGLTESEYKDQSYSINRFKLDYKLSENVTLTDDFYYTVAGFYKESAEGGAYGGMGRITNRIGLSYNLY